MKPDTAVSFKKAVIFTYQNFSNDVHYELEVVVKISKGGKYIQEENASKHYDEIALGIDFTAKRFTISTERERFTLGIGKRF